MSSADEEDDEKWKDSSSSRSLPPRRNQTRRAKSASASPIPEFLTTNCESDEEKKLLKVKIDQMQQKVRHLTF